MSLYLMCVYGESDHSKWFQSAWAKTGKKLDMGKACIRFKKLDDLALDVIAEAIRRVPAKKYIAHCEAVLKDAKTNRAQDSSKAAGTVKSRAAGTKRTPARKSPGVGT